MNLRSSAIVLHTEQRPYDMLYFLLAVMHIASVGDLLVTGLLTGTLWSWWHFSVVRGQCFQIMRFWNACMLILFLIRTFAREWTAYKLLVMSVTNRLLREPQDMADAIRLCFQSRSWRICHVAGHISYFWLCLGVVWMVKKQVCADTRMFFLPLGITAFVCIRHLIIKRSFDLVFPTDSLISRPLFWKQHQRIRAMIPRLFRELPMCTVEDCSICFETFSNDDEVCMLQCKHVFHQRCIGTWLTKTNKCPLCIRDVGDMYIQHLEERIRKLKAA